MTYFDKEASGALNPGEIIEADTARFCPYRDFAKRGLDLLLLLMAAPFYLPLLAVIAIAVRAEGGPVLFRQARLGRGGEVFWMVKIRTMVPNADRLLQEHLDANPAARREWDVHQKLLDDPRLTRVGRVLRRLSLDELPQLWNVLVGDMALVGPRPMTVEQGPLYPGKAYYALRPGITGPWQVSDRHASTFVARASYDTAYLRTLSLGQDVILLLKTLWVVVRCTGR